MQSFTSLYLGGMKVAIQFHTEIKHKYNINDAVYKRHLGGAGHQGVGILFLFLFLKHLEEAFEIFQF